MSIENASPTGTSADHRPSRMMAALCGVLAGALGLGLAELIAGLVPGAPSPDLSLGALLISLQPPGAKDFVVNLFGTNDKLALSVAVALGALVISALIGLLARRSLLAGRLAFGALGLFALFAAVLDPLFDPVLAIATAAVAIGVSAWSLGWLLRLATPRTPDAPRMMDFERRRFLGAALGVGAAAVTSGLIGRTLLNQRSAAVADLPTIPAPQATAAPLPAGSQLAVDGITPLVVKNRDFYRIDTSLLVPHVNASTWTLTVNGMVDHPFTIDYDELLAMPLIEQYVTIACVSNKVGGDLVGNALWRGARLRDLLDRAGVQAGATQLVGRDFGGWTAGFPTAWLDVAEREPLVAVAMNGEPLPPEHGFPARLIVPGLYGYVSATKWLANIELTTLEAFDGYWVPLGWAKEAPILTQSRIDVPGFGASLGAGRQPVAGVAWAPDRGISKVEVQVDDGPWAPAELSTPISDATWVQWVFRWDAPAGDHTLRVRATDGTGQVQTAEETEPAPDGARGYHTIDVSVG
jgi:DMSO/TMAO reductase YedYZ molybdopterin-dependent catalytic subunit